MQEKQLIKRTEARCDVCPLDGVCNKVWGRSNVEKPKVVFLGEAPGAEEDAGREPFVGPAGNWLKNAVKHSGMMWHTIHKTNTISCRPPGNDINSFEATEALDCCSRGMWQELKMLYERGMKVLVPLGTTALKSLGFNESISKARGSIYPAVWADGKLERTDSPSYDVLIAPTYHPSYIMRGQMKEEPTWINDLRKIYEVSTTNYKPPREDFLLHPTIEQVEQRVDKALEHGKTLGIDIEATSLVAERAKVVMVGIAESESRAFCVPFYKQGGKSYWKSKDENVRAHKAVKRLLEQAPTAFQNCLYDIRVLKANGMPVGNLKHDLLLLHHALSPELPHNLGFIVSEYGKTPYWKDVVLKSEKQIFAQPDHEFRTYNLRDSIVLLQCLKPLIRDCKKYGSYAAYQQFSMPLVPVIDELMSTGLKLSKSRLAKFRRDLQERIDEAVENIRRVADLREGFNLNSGDHIRRLLYGELPKAHKKRVDELALYDDPAAKRRKNTKRFIELNAQVEAIEKTKPFAMPRGARPSKTASGQSAIDKQQMMRIAVACNNRIHEIDELKRKQASHKKERIELERIKEFLAYYRDYQDNHKMFSTYTTFPISSDGRVHFPYKIHGTYTGRLASGNKSGGEAGNIQNFPKEARKIFIPEEGNTFIQADYANLELHILAVISGDKVLLEAFDNYFAGTGDKPHAINCKMLFGIDQDDPMWKTYYDLTKRYIFGRNYGGTLRGIYEKLMQDLPEMPITFAQFKDIDARYRRQHPEYDVWYNKTVEQVSKQRWLRNPFGRIRYFLGNPNEIVREGLNFPIQSTAADIMNGALIAIHKEKQLSPKKWSAMKLCATVHDSILVETKDCEVDKTVKMLVKHMQHPVKMEDKEIVFHTEIETGKDWLNLEER